MPGIVTGTGGPDLIDASYTGDAEGDQIDNNDAPVTGGNEDFVNAGDGDDTVFAGLDDDTVLGGNGNDELHGEAGSDSLIGGVGSDQLFGGDGDDTLDGGADNDTLHGGIGNDEVYGGAGDDYIELADAVSNNTIDGGVGDDTLSLSTLGAGTNVFFTGDGSASVTSGTGANATVTGIEGLELSNHADVVNATASSINQTIDGNGGADVIVGGSGSDSITGGSGNDSLLGGLGADTITGGVGADMIAGSEGTDSLFGGDDDDTFLIQDNDGNDTIFGGEGGIDDDNLDATGLSSAVTVTFTGDEEGTIANATLDVDFNEVEVFNLTDHDDTIVTGDSTSTFNAGDGADILTMGLTQGDNTYNAGESGTDIDTLSGDGLTDGVSLFFSGDEQGTMGSGSGLVHFTEVESFVLTEHNDVVNGAANDMSIIIDGGDGHDVINTGDNADTIYGGTGTDSIGGAGGDDVIFAGADNDTITGGTGSDTISADSGDDSIQASVGNDVITGGDGSDIVDYSVADTSALTLNVTSNAAGDMTVNMSDGSVQTLSEIETLQASNANGGATDTFTVTEAIDRANVSNFDDTAVGTFTDSFGTVINFGPAETAQLSDILAAHAAGTIAITSGDRDGTFSSLSIDDFEAVTFDVTCFAKGTKIKMRRGECKVERLKVGEKLPTLDHGLQTIRWIGKKTVPGVGRFAPVRIRAGALGNKNDLLLSQSHRIYLNDWRAELLFGEPEVLVLAKSLINDSTITLAPCKEVTYYHILFDQHELIRSEGIFTESFQPSEYSLGTLDEDVREEVYDLFPELREHPLAASTETARKSLRHYEGQMLNLAS